MIVKIGSFLQLSLPPRGDAFIVPAQETTDVRQEGLTFNAEASTPGKSATLGGCEDDAGPPSGPRASSSESESESPRLTFVSGKQKITVFFPSTGSFVAKTAPKQIV